MTTESNEKERKPFLTESDKHAIWDAARWAADEGAGDLLTVVNDIIARHVGYALSCVVRLPPGGPDA